MKIATKKVIVVTVILYVLALAVRLYGISYSAITTDEQLWNYRAHRAIKNIETTPSQWSNFLGHPGIPPTLVMGIGQKIAEKYNLLLHLAPTDRGYIDSLIACRISNSLVSALIVPVTFIALVLFGEYIFALFVALLIALDPNQIGAARMAHLDSIMSLLVVSTFFLYLGSVYSRQSVLTLTSGVLWGLAVITKPTAVILIPVFVLFRLLKRYWLINSAQLPNVQEKIPFIRWADLGALALGFSTMLLLYTRLWHHPSIYVKRLGITNHFATWQYRLAHRITSYGYYVYLLPLATLIGSILLWRRYWSTRKRITFHLAACSTTLTLLIAFWLLFPQAIDNLIRFWIWVAGLSKVPSTSFASGHLVAPPRFGYFALIFENVSDLQLCGSIVGLIFIAKNGLQGRITRNFELAFISIVLALIWLGVLNISPKQSWRYALPVLFGISMLAAYGYMQLFEVLKKGLSIEKARKVILVGVFFGASLTTYDLIRFSPHYFLFKNIISGGLLSSIERGHRLPDLATPEVVSFLADYTNAQPKRSVAPIESKIKHRISVFGGAKIYELATRIHQPNSTEELRFSTNLPPQVSHYRIEQLPKVKLHEYHEWDITKAHPPLFTYNFQGVELVSVFKVVRE